MAGAKNKRTKKAIKKFLRERRQQLLLRSHLADSPFSRETAKEIAKLYDQELIEGTNGK